MPIDANNARKLMETAVEAMKQTMHEPRKDGKISPSVGAAILKPDGTIETSCRGELRHGDHAEYTLLDRKNRDKRLDGSVLFVTLEPCAPDSRHPPKLSCSERIINARIKEVWIGLEDPDPSVDHKGIKYLQENGVTVHMFSPDLQEAIREINKDFLAQALQRADSAGSTKKIILSAMEETNETAKLQNLSAEALGEYCKKAGIDEKMGSVPFYQRLAQQGLLTEKDGNFTPTGFGLLLFGDKPRNIIHQAGLLATIRYPDGKEETRDFNDPLVLIPTLFEKWLMSRLPAIHDRSQMVSSELYKSFPYVLIREAVVNALIHRDYDIAGAKCQVTITEHLITIKSPGAPTPPITVEQMQSFDAPMLSRNPKLHYVFRQMGIAEERGLGLKSLKSAAEKYNLPAPKYSFYDPYLELTLFTTPESAIELLSSEIRNSLNKDEIAGWQIVSARDKITKPEYARLTGFSYDKAERHLRKFVELKLLSRIGKGRSTVYLVK